MRRFSKRDVFYLLAGSVSGMILAGYVMVPWFLRQWYAPLGPGLELPTLANTPAGPARQTAAGSLAASAQISEGTRPPPTQTSLPTARPLCGGPPVMTVLAVGADNRVDNYLYGLADVVRVVRVDFIAPRVSVLSLPRDLWVEIPGIEDHHGITHGKLNQAYLYGGPGMGYYDGPGGGPGLLARTLDLNFGLRVDHYVAVNMVTFVRMVDALGGIDVYLPEAVDGRPIDEHTEDMGYFPAGEHHFTGDEALRFSRIRKKYNDFTRMDNQNLVLCALREKLLSPAVLPRIPELVAAFQDSVQTDLSPAQISQLACLAPRVERENLLLTGLPQDLLEPGKAYSAHLQGETFVYRADWTAVRGLLAAFQAGLWPDQPEEPGCP